MGYHITVTGNSTQEEELLKKRAEDESARIREASLLPQDRIRAYRNVLQPGLIYPMLCHQ